jgi:radical S-adenosyl methionine domain-containing protein 2
MNDKPSLIGASELPETINIHLTRRCNFGCHFCYAEFAECGANQVSPENLQSILAQIGERPSPNGRRRKINFAGGEPFLYPDLPTVIEFCKKRGLVTSVVTNGSRIDSGMIARLGESLDILGLSVDSGNLETNRKIGRYGNRVFPHAEFYRRIATKVHEAGIRLKINTVVNRVNFHEDLGVLISALVPFRWKLFQVKEVIGQNDKLFAGLSISKSEFDQFVARNKMLVRPDTLVIAETADDMTASYAMIAPNGCFFDCSRGRYHYSRPICDVGVLEAFQDVAFEPQKFHQRGGSYE